MPRRLTHNEVEERIRLKHGDKFTLLENFNSNVS